MRPANLTSQIFLDSGDPAETQKALDVMGFLDGQTTNPTLLAKSPIVITTKEKEGHISQEKILPLYKDIIQEIASLIPDGSISIEIFADFNTSHDEMLRQAREMYEWTPNAHLKFPIIPEGLMAAHQFSSEGKRINMTLCFSQDQAAAVYSATLGSSRGDVYVSPFIGRLDEIWQNGVSLIANILKMYQPSDHHVEVLAASIRTVDQLMAALAVKCDIITSRYSVLEEWAQKGMPIPDENYTYDQSLLQDIPYKELNLSQPFTSFDIKHDLTTKGIEKFVQDINTLLA